MKKNYVQRLLAMTLAATMTLGSVSLPVNAAEETGEGVTEQVQEPAPEVISEEPAGEEQPAAEAETAEEEQPAAEAETAEQEQPAAEAETAEEGQPAAEAETAEEEQPVAEAETTEEKQSAAETETAEEEQSEEEAETAEEEQPAAEAETAAETSAQGETQDVTAESADVETVQESTADAAVITANTVEIAGREYAWADFSGAGEGEIKVLVGETEHAAADFTMIGETGIGYYSAEPLTGKVYGTAIQRYSDFYQSVGVNASAQDYDAITSATAFASRHAGDIPAIIARDDEGIHGIVQDVNVDAPEYVEASVLQAAGKELTPGQMEILEDIKLNEDPTAANSYAGGNVEVAAASYNYSCNYGDGEFVINMDESVDGYVWTDYKNALYAAVISDGSNSAGAVWWVDLYGESATAGPHYNKVEIAVNNGTSKGSNASEVNRFAAMYHNEKPELKAGTYTVTLYAKGYNTVSADIQVKESYDWLVQAALSKDRKSVELTGGLDDFVNPRVSVSRTEGTGRQRVTYTYADQAAVTDGKVELDTSVNKLVTATYTVTIESDNYAPYTTTFDYDETVYALVNIPYSTFYGTSGASVADVDAVSSATNKTGNYSFAGGAFHSGTTADESGNAVGGANGSKMQGVIWAVKADKLEEIQALGGNEVTDESSVVTATAGHGSVSSQTLVGYEALAEQPAYSYYLLDEAPSSYMELKDGSFSAAGGAEQMSAADVDVIYGSHWGDVQMNVTASEVSDKLVSAIVLTADDGTQAGLYHLDQIWRGTQLAWNADALVGLDGKKITNVRFYCMVKDGDLTDGAAPSYANYVYDYPVDAQIMQVYTGEITAAFTDADELTITGIPEDAQNVKANVYYSAGRGSETIYLTPLTVDTEDDTIDPVPADVKDGKVTIAAGSVTNNAGTTKNYGEPTVGTVYTVALSSDNYVLRGTSAEFTKQEQKLSVKAEASPIVAGTKSSLTVTGAKGKLTFTSSDESVAVVGSTGKISARSAGIVKFTVTSEETDLYNAASKTITVKVVPGATTAVKAANTASGVKLTWSKVGKGATGYKIYRGSTLIKTIANANTLTFTDTAVKAKNGAKYTYKVMAYTKNVGYSTLSKTVSIYRLVAPTVSPVKNTAAGRMTVTYTKNAKATGYQIRYSQNLNMSGAKTVTVNAKTLSKVIAATKGKTYYVQVRAYERVSGKNYYSDWSSKRSVKIKK
ncbi:MAG: hypothetical protein IJG52_04930 [Lachnospiraceae bacterium]|nr:hypothetical protein [Lachnospiraceae bacterium]